MMSRKKIGAPRVRRSIAFSEGTQTKLTEIRRGTQATTDSAAIEDAIDVRAKLLQAGILSNEDITQVLRIATKLRKAGILSDLDIERMIANHSVCEKLIAELGPNGSLIGQHPTKDDLRLMPVFV